MVAFPRMMITIAGIALMIILALAAQRFFPGHARVAEAAGIAIGLAINIVLQIGLWSAPSRSA
jgi:hypothetical protein